MQFNKTFDDNNPVTVTTSASSTQLNVTANGKLKTEDSEAGDFNSMFTINNRFGLDTSASAASALDLYLIGTLTINNNLILGVGLAHEHKNRNWWLGGGNRIGSTTEFSLQDVNGNYYCLTQNGTNYQVRVSIGNCPDAEQSQFIFKFGRQVESIEFIPLESPESGQISSVTTSGDSNGYTVTINSTLPINSTEIANSFNSLMLPSKCSEAMNVFNVVYSFQLHEQGLVCGPAPQYLDFYIPANLKINNSYVRYKSSEEPREFILAHGQGRWWLGTVDSPFEGYGGGGATYNNHATIGTGYLNSKGNIVDEYYILKADTDNSFIVNYDN